MTDKQLIPLEWVGSSNKDLKNGNGKCRPLPSIARLGNEHSATRIRIAGRVKIASNQMKIIIILIKKKEKLIIMVLLFFRSRGQTESLRKTRNVHPHKMGREGKSYFVSLSLFLFRLYVYVCACVLSGGLVSIAYFERYERPLLAATVWLYTPFLEQLQLLSLELAKAVAVVVAVAGRAHRFCQYRAKDTLGV